MAIVALTLPYTQTIFPFQGLSEVPRERSDVPRSELICQLQGAAVASGGVGDSTHLSLTASLGQNFSYVMVDFYLGIFGQTAAASVDYEDLASMNLNNAVSGIGRDYAMLSSPFSRGEQNFGGTNVRMKTYQLDRYENIVVLAPPSRQAGLTVSIFNPTLDDQDYSVNSMVRFLVYDVNQTHHYQVNTPVVVR